MRQLLNSAGLVKLRINREYNRFKYRLMKMKKEQIIDKCGKIHFYSCVREYFEYNEQVPEEVFQFLLKQKDILYQLWELFIKWEQLGYSTWEQIDDLISFWMHECSMISLVRR